MNTKHILPVYIVNAFTRDQFAGNPAAVVPLKEWLPDETMQQIAAQHNLSETSFIVEQDEGYSIRWFTPGVEVDLCGHATLAAAHIFFTSLGYAKEKISFQSRSGVLHVLNKGDGKLTLDFPSNEPVEVEPLESIEQGLGIKPISQFQSTFDYMAVFENQKQIERLDPDFSILAKIPARGLITTAPGDYCDFVSRCFYPQSGINEDPVTGSAHTIMTPYWSRKLNKKRLKAVQISARKGWLDCEWRGDRVLISGEAITYLEGSIFL
jgi:PhzF family phenazine biosynthesis protein